jgi:hypothetical protein
MPGDDPIFLGYSPNGLGRFRAADGSEIEADLEASPYARAIAAGSGISPAVPPPPDAGVMLPRSVLDAATQGDPEMPYAGYEAPPAPPRIAQAYQPTIAPPAARVIPPGVAALTGAPPSAAPGPEQLEYNPEAGVWRFRMPDGSTATRARGPGGWGPLTPETAPGELPAAPPGIAAITGAPAMSTPPPAAPGYPSAIAAITGFDAPPEGSPMLPRDPQPRPLPRAGEQPGAGGAPVLDLTGGASARPGGGRGGRPGAAAAPLNPDEQLLDALTHRPRGNPLAPGDFRGENALERAQRLGAQRGVLEQRRAETAGMAGAEIQDQHEAAAAQHQREQMERQQAMGAARQRYDRAVQRVQAMHVDPQRIMRTSGGMIGGLLAVGLGAIGQVVAGRDVGANPVLAQITHAIDEDIAAQQANIANAQQGLEGEANIFRQMEQEFESREAATAATRQMLLEATAARIAQMESGLDNAEARQRAEELRAQIEQQAQAAGIEAVRAEEDRALANQLMRARIAEREANAIRAQRRAAGTGGAASGPNEYSIPGAVWDGQTDQSAADRSTVRRFVGMTGAALTAVRRAISLRERFGGEVVDRDAVARMGEARESIITALRTIENTGVPQEHEMRRFEARVPDASAFATLDVLPRLRALEQSMTETADAAITPYGYRLGFGPAADQAQQEQAAAAVGGRRVE